MIIYCVRHGTTLWTDEKRYCGTSDPALNTQGQAEAHRVGKALATVAFEHIYSSPLTRCWQTATTIAQYLSAPVAITQDPRLQEIHYGNWEGKTRQEIKTQDRRAFDDWDDDPTKQPPPGGESVFSVETRTQQFLQDIFQKQHRYVLLVAHRTVFRIMLASLMGMPLAFYRKRLDHHPCAVTIFELMAPGEAKLLLYNASIDRPF